MLFPFARKSWVVQRNTKLSLSRFPWTGDGAGEQRGIRSWLWWHLPLLSWFLLEAVGRSWPSSWLFGVGISGRELYRIHLAPRHSPWWFSSWPRAYLLLDTVGLEICIVSLTSGLQAGYFLQPTWMFLKVHFRLTLHPIPSSRFHSSGQLSLHIFIPMNCTSLSLPS